MAEPERKPVERRPPARLRVVRVGEGVDVERREPEDLTLSPPTPTTPTTPRAARAARAGFEAFAGRVLARWLARELGTAGAARLVRRFGVAAIVEALRDGVVVGSELVEVQVPGTHPTNPGAEWWTYRRTWKYQFAAGLHTPGGYLWRLLREGERSEGL